MIDKTALIKQASRLMEDEDQLMCWNFRQAKSLMCEVTKQGNFIDWMKNPLLQTILSLLTPLVGKSYKVEQVIKILQEIFKDMSNG